jgi:hypothetical protein
MTELDDLDLDDLDLDEDLETEDSKESASVPDEDEMELDDLDLDEDLPEEKPVTKPVVDDAAEDTKATAKDIKKKVKPKSETSINDDTDFWLDEDEPVLKVVKQEPKKTPKAVTASEEDVVAASVKTGKPEVKAEPKAEFAVEPPIIEEVVEAPVAPVIKKKASKKAKPDPKPEDEVINGEFPPTPISIRYIPDFDISPKNLDTKTYQIRKTKRDSAVIEEMKNSIELQGQVEPIQITICDGVNYLIAGEGRVLALRRLDRPAKALVYEGLSEDDILKISFGTNECRLEMSEWDRINSIGNYYEKNPDVSKDDPSDKKSLVSVFGLNKSSIYSYLKLWKFYKDKEDFHVLYSKYRCPLYILSTVAEILADYVDQIETYKPIISAMSKIVRRNDINRNNFNNIFLKDITDILLDVKMSKTTLDIETVDMPLDDAQLAKTEKNARDEIKQKIKLSEAEQIEKRLENNTANAEKKEKTEKLLESIDKNLDSAIMALNEIGEIADFHKLIHSDVIKKTVKRVSKINQLVTILV